MRICVISRPACVHEEAGTRSTARLLFISAEVCVTLAKLFEQPNEGVSRVTSDPRSNYHHHHHHHHYHHYYYYYYYYCYYRSPSRDLTSSRVVTSVASSIHIRASGHTPMRFRAAKVTRGIYSGAARRDAAREEFFEFFARSANTTRHTHETPQFAAVIF